MHLLGRGYGYTDTTLSVRPSVHPDVSPKVCITKIYRYKVKPYMNTSWHLNLRSCVICPDARIHGQGHTRPLCVQCLWALHCSIVISSVNRVAREIVWGHLEVQSVNDRCKSNKGSNWNGHMISFFLEHYFLFNFVLFFNQHKTKQIVSSVTTECIL